MNFEAVREIKNAENDKKCGFCTCIHYAGGYCVGCAGGECEFMETVYSQETLN